MALLYLNIIIAVIAVIAVVVLLAAFIEAYVEPKFNKKEVKLTNEINEFLDKE